MSERNMVLEILSKKLNVIVPIYKGSHYIFNLIDILENNWKFINEIENLEIELVLVNDYPEEKLVIEDQWIKNISLLEITNPKNQGIHFSRVQGLLHSDGEYVLFLDQDDEISPVYVREQMSFLKNYDAVICNGKNRGNLIYRNAAELKKAVDIDEYMVGENHIVSPGQVLLRRAAIPREWIENILLKNGADDYFLWVLMFQQKCKIRIQDKILYLHMIHGNNTSKNIEEMNQSVFEVLNNLVQLEYISRDEEKQIKGKKNQYLEKYEISVEEYQKEHRYKVALELWMSLRDRKISIKNFLNKKSIKKIAIYGAGIFGKHLYYELQESNIQVVCFIDCNQSIKISGLKTLSPGDSLENIDAIIVTPFMEYKQIELYLKQFYLCNIMSIETLLFNADCELMTE